MNKRIDPTTKFVRSLEGEYYKLTEAAEYLKVSPASLRKFIKDDSANLGPSKVAYFGRTTIYLYTKDDLSKISEYLETRRRVFDSEGQIKKSGRPKKWTEEEKKERQQLFSSLYYYKKQSQRTLESGTTEDYQAACRKIEEIQNKLKEQENGK